MTRRTRRCTLLLIRDTLLRATTNHRSFFQDLRYIERFENEMYLYDHWWLRVKTVTKTIICIKARSLGCYISSYNGGKGSVFFFFFPYFTYRHSRERGVYQKPYEILFILYLIKSFLNPTRRSFSAQSKGVVCPLRKCINQVEDINVLKV